MARDQHSGAIDVLMETAEWLAAALTTYANLLDPEVIVLGGYGTPLADALIPPIQAHLERSLLSARWAPSKLIPACTGPDAALLGAGLLALETVFREVPRLHAPSSATTPREIRSAT
jgi:glucokinase